MEHWAVKYIGKPWERVEHNCWTFFRIVQHEQFGRDIPDYAFDASNRRNSAQAVSANPERSNWEKVETPKEGDAVLLAHARFPSHVGVWVDADGGGVLHCVNGPGVVFQSVTILKASGWGHLEFYRYAAS